MKSFYDVNTDILRKINDSRNFCRISQKNGYIAIRSHEYEIYELNVLLYKNSLKIEPSVSCMGCSGEYIEHQYEYFTASEYEILSNDDKKDYKKRTLAYIAALFDYADSLSYCFEHYSWAYDFQKIIIDYVKNHPFNDSFDSLNSDEWLSAANNPFKGYLQNAFLLYPCHYPYNLAEHTELLKSLPTILHNDDNARPRKRFIDYYLGKERYRDIVVKELFWSDEVVNE